MMVSLEQRKQNSKAAMDMEQWRNDYWALATAIRRNKARLRDYRRYNNDVIGLTAETMCLRVLRQQACAMMEKRKQIKNVLRRTAYAYASKENG